mmetsp:Transcript_14160/g.20304  ORF Transcript_14160/g.20304 Transcript_14160/m.20304 type:complete len:199 (+) Transcript_14160:202-798(+)|eukprot:CAMPEP_0172420982 /NCGR_PEP_ID=MMETSP1064-20121228/7273_1 /TAXON_ID=202472 /ORGANISM="Aulacoseira subarctica , Strain CCAP 1002/5" /LENGTH=198 /DNA_ID=CAMNT_0013161157 /DNA_START=177 /DNA_END=773 /DNA_ORIENTATION=+
MFFLGTEFTEQDVRCGFGSKAYTTAGNVLFRNLINFNRNDYRSSSDINARKRIVASIVDAIHSQTPPGRFLEQKGCTGVWNEMEIKRTFVKVAQALRERSRSKECQRRKNSNECKVEGSVNHLPLIDPNNALSDTCSSDVKINSNIGVEISKKRLEDYVLSDAQSLGSDAESDCDKLLEMFIGENLECCVENATTSSK